MIQVLTIVSLIPFREYYVLLLDFKWGQFRQNDPYKVDVVHLLEKLDLVYNFAKGVAQYFIPERGRQDLDDLGFIIFVIDRLIVVLNELLDLLRELKRYARFLGQLG